MTWREPKMIAPPGVIEAAQVTLDVGDPGKVAIAFMGSTNSPGPPYPKLPFCSPPSADVNCLVNDLDQSVNFGPVPGYENTTWNGYVAVTTNALSHNPTFLAAPVNDPSDPLERGVCGPLRCQAGYDFIDIVIAPDGVPYASFVDACAKTCDALGNGVIGTLDGGPSLRSERHDHGGA
jgi:hypothetical protein